MTEPTTTAEAKPFWQSKTLCLSVVAAVTPLVTQAFPEAGAFLRDNADLACAAVGALFGVLRLITKGRITLG